MPEKLMTDILRNYFYGLKGGWDSTLDGQDEYRLMSRVLTKLGRQTTQLAAGIQDYRSFQFEQEMKKPQILAALFISNKGCYEEGVPPVYVQLPLCTNPASSELSRLLGGSTVGLRRSRNTYSGRVNGNHPRRVVNRVSSLTLKGREHGR